MLSALVAAGRLDQSSAARTYLLAEQQNVPTDRLLLRLGLVEEPDLIASIAELNGFDVLNNTDHAIDQDALRKLGADYWASQLVVPLASGNPELPVVMADPLNVLLQRELAFHLERSIRVIAATTQQIRALLAQNPTDKLEQDPTERLTERDAAQLRKAGVDGPVIRFVQETLADAVLRGASDIHVETTEDSYTVRYRLNGVLVQQRGLPTLNPLAISARLKVMAGLNVAERRLPQDGRFQTIVAGRRVDFRFSSLPTQLGESIVARVLDPKALRLGWDKLGFDTEIISWVQKILDLPSGLFLVTGPTGSGKTTTLYTALSYLNTPSRKIVTVEDPVEYNLAGVQQIQVHDEIGLSFARILRGVLRHDPNVIMVGEIRDSDTAEIAIRAAQVGRLVLSTLHTNSAAGALNRLVDLGSPEFLVRDVLRGVLGQELQLTSCRSCSGKGCVECGGTGVGERRLQVQRWQGD
ncbi:GspE/PulE family protein [Roseinatronobacter alkalisoli]|uniref:ATPase, T2SS/T4P/T4SS family n=1 Tax=Roseinatronobacter alkalisoli TaxID=3028235 RepID=A0ABT5TF07_9RHOB|nr:type II/IV secretion system protein [Roseinatronobacter sp. HJB301]MDD7973708.1 ATPase, T2SS/T4P/T4SS family [Roseinatronobacter sp. HJB301]